MRMKKQAYFELAADRKGLSKQIIEKRFLGLLGLKAAIYLAGNRSASHF